MWLINTTTLELEEFQQCPINTYAILSHTWGSSAEELTFDMFISGQGRQKLGFEKIRGCCSQARKDGLKYAWVDTCCINKQSSTELSEAINSMFTWYQSAALCYVYLSDVRHHDPLMGSDEDCLWTQSRWFTRGWTLQELIAPLVVTFYSRDWERIGGKANLAQDLCLLTQIPVEVLTSQKHFLDCCIAQRMSWASRRKTTRIEDRAYCLLGLFNVNIPLLYGEGQMSFLRLQEAIIARTDDESIFTWTGIVDADEGHGLLAPSPANFIDATDVERGKGFRERPPYEMTNRGLSLECELLPCAMNTYLIPLQCVWTSAETEDEQIAIFVCRTSRDDQYRRVSFQGECVSATTGWDISKAKISNILVPNEGRGLELMPHSSLPCIIVEPNSKVRDPWHDPATTAGEDLERIQLQLCDLEHGRVLVSDHLEYRALSIGFDMDFRPVCVLHPLRIRGFLGRIDIPDDDAFWRNEEVRTKREDLIHNIKRLYFYQHRRGIQFRTVGSRLGGLERRIDQSSLFASNCMCVNLSLRPQNGLEWRLVIDRGICHPQKHWMNPFCPVGTLRMRQMLKMSGHESIFSAVCALGLVSAICLCTSLIASIHVLGLDRGTFFLTTTFTVVLAAAWYWIFRCIQRLFRFFRASTWQQPYDPSWNHDKAPSVMATQRHLPRTQLNNDIELELVRAPFGQQKWSPVLPSRI